MPSFEEVTKQRLNALESQNAALMARLASMEQVQAHQASVLLDMQREQRANFAAVLAKIQETNDLLEVVRKGAVKGE